MTRSARLDASMVLFLGAWLVGLLQFFFRGGYGFGQGFEIVAVARSLAEQGTYANPFAPNLTGPTAMVPPLHPLFLAALLRIFQTDAGMRIAAVFANILANALIAALLPKLALLLFDDAVVGAIAGGLWICAMRLLPQFDVSNTILLELCFCLLTLRRNSPLVAGLLAGAMLLLNPATALVTGPWIVWLMVTGRMPWRAAAIAVAAAALCLMPWMFRNYGIWGVFATRTNFGLTIFNSNNDCASPSLYEEAVSGCIQQTFPVDSASEAALIRDLGEVRYDRLRTADTMHWIAAHPQRFVRLTAARAVDFWFPDPRPDLYTCYTIWVITLLSIPGIVLAVRHRRTIAPLILAVWLLYPLMYYVVVSCDRYRYPIIWTSLLPAGYAVRRLLLRASHQLRA